MIFFARYLLLVRRRVPARPQNPETNRSVTHRQATLGPVRGGRRFSPIVASHPIEGDLVASSSVLSGDCRGVASNESRLVISIEENSYRPFTLLERPLKPQHGAVGVVETIDVVRESLIGCDARIEWTFMDVPGSIAVWTVVAAGRDEDEARSIAGSLEEFS